MSWKLTQVIVGTGFAASLCACTSLGILDLSQTKPAALTPPDWLIGTWKSGPDAATGVVVATSNDVKLDSKDFAPVAQVQSVNGTESYGVILHGEKSPYTFINAKPNQIFYSDATASMIKLYRDGVTPVSPPKWLHGKWLSAVKNDLPWIFTSSTVTRGTGDLNDYTDLVLSQEASSSTFSFTWGTRGLTQSARFDLQPDGTVTISEAGWSGSVKKETLRKQ